MIGPHFYNKTVKRAIIAFGTLFNNISVNRRYKSGKAKVIPVSVSYGPREKWLELSRKKSQQFMQNLPKMSFEATTMNYDVNRKLVTNNRVKVARNTDAGFEVDSNLAPTPYNLNFTMYIQAKNLDDGWQIIEQIVPFFTPAYTLKIKDSSSIENEINMPITLTSVTWADDYQGAPDDRRLLEFTLEFDAKVNFYGPSTKGTSGIILKTDTIVAGVSESIDLQRVDRVITANSSFGGAFTYDQGADANTLDLKASEYNSIKDWKQVLYSPADTYSKGDIVFYQGNFYRAVQDIPINRKPEPNTVAFWRRFSSPAISSGDGNSESFSRTVQTGAEGITINPTEPTIKTLQGILSSSPSTPLLLPLAPDLIPPTLLFWRLNFDTEQIILTFDEAIDAGQVNPQLLTIYGRGPAGSHTLSSQVFKTIGTGDTPEIILDITSDIVEITNVTLNALPGDERRVALEAREGFALDIFGNAALDIDTPTAEFIQNPANPNDPNDVVPTGNLVGNNPIEIINSSADTVKPFVINQGFVIDLEENLLQIFWDDNLSGLGSNTDIVVDPIGLNLTLTLPTNVADISVSGNVFLMRLTDADVLTIDSHFYNAQNFNNRLTNISYSIPAQLVLDDSGNENDASTADIGVINPLDRVSPVIRDFSLNLGNTQQGTLPANSLRLNFAGNEPKGVKIDSFDLSKLFITGVGQTLAGDNFISLDGSTILEGASPGTISLTATILPTAGLLDSIERITQNGSRPLSLFATDTFVDDFRDNSSVAYGTNIPSNGGNTFPTLVIRDEENPPSLLDWSLDLSDSGASLRLFFSTDIDIPTFRRELVSVGGLNNKKTLDPSTLTVQNSVITFNLAQSDIDFLRVETGNIQSGAFLNLVGIPNPTSDATVLDNVGNPIDSITDLQLTTQGSFVPGRPIGTANVNSFLINLQSNLLTIEFDRDIDLTNAFIYKPITIKIPGGTRMLSSLETSNYAFSNSGNRTFTLNISDALRDTLQSDFGNPVVSLNINYIIPADFVIDTFGNSSIEVDTTTNPGLLIPFDNNDPEILDWKINLDNNTDAGSGISGNTLILTFGDIDPNTGEPIGEPIGVNASTLDLSKIFVTGFGEANNINPTYNRKAVPLTGGTTTATGIVKEISISLNQSLLDEIERVTWNGAAPVQIFTEDNFIEDASGRTGKAQGGLGRNDNVNASIIIRDSDITGVSLDSWDIDLVLNTATLTFLPTIDASTFDLSKITFGRDVNNANDIGVGLTTTGADQSTFTSLGNVITISLSAIDVLSISVKGNNIRSTTPIDIEGVITTSPPTGDATVLDLEGNPNQPTLGLLTSTPNNPTGGFIPRTTQSAAAPTLQSVHIDFNTDVMTLNFENTDPVRNNPINIQTMVFSSSNTKINNGSYRLTSGTVITTGFSDVIEVQLNSDDAYVLGLLTYNGDANLTSNTTIEVDSGLAQDADFNPSNTLKDLDRLTNTTYTSNTSSGFLLPNPQTETATQNNQTLFILDDPIPGTTNPIITINDNSFLGTVDLTNRAQPILAGTDDQLPDIGDIVKFSLNGITNAALDINLATRIITIGFENTVAHSIPIGGSNINILSPLDFTLFANTNGTGTPSYVLGTAPGDGKSRINSDNTSSDIIIELGLLVGQGDTLAVENLFFVSKDVYEVTNGASIVLPPTDISNNNLPIIQDIHGNPHLEELIFITPDNNNRFTPPADRTLPLLTNADLTLSNTPIDNKLVLTYDDTITNFRLNDITIKKIGSTNISGTVSLSNNDTVVTILLDPATTNQLFTVTENINSNILLDALAGHVTNTNNLVSDVITDFPVNLIPAVINLGNYTGFNMDLSNSSGPSVELLFSEIVDQTFTWDSNQLLITGIDTFYRTGNNGVSLNTLSALDAFTEAPTITFPTNQSVKFQWTKTRDLIDGFTQRQMHNSLLAITQNPSGGSNSIDTISVGFNSSIGQFDTTPTTAPLSVNPFSIRGSNEILDTFQRATVTKSGSTFIGLFPDTTSANRVNIDLQNPDLFLDLKFNRAVAFPGVDGSFDTGDLGDYFNLVPGSIKIKVGSNEHSLELVNGNNDISLTSDTSIVRIRLSETDRSEIRTLTSEYTIASELISVEIAAGTVRDNATYLENLTDTIVFPSGIIYGNTLLPQVEYYLLNGDKLSIVTNTGLFNSSIDFTKFTFTSSFNSNVYTPSTIEASGITHTSTTGNYLASIPGSVLEQYTISSEVRGKFKELYSLNQEDTTFISTTSSTLPIGSRTAPTLSLSAGALTSTFGNLNPVSSGITSAQYKPRTDIESMTITPTLNSDFADDKVRFIDDNYINLLFDSYLDFNTATPKIRFKHYLDLESFDQVSGVIRIDNALGLELPGINLGFNVDGFVFSSQLGNGAQTIRSISEADNKTTLIFTSNDYSEYTAANGKVQLHTYAESTNPDVPGSFEFNSVISSVSNPLSHVAEFITIESSTSSTVTFNIITDINDIVTAIGDPNAIGNTRIFFENGFSGILSSGTNNVITFTDIQDESGSNSSFDSTLANDSRIYANSLGVSISSDITANLSIGDAIQTSTANTIDGGDNRQIVRNLYAISGTTHIVIDDYTGYNINGNIFYGNYTLPQFKTENTITVNPSNGVVTTPSTGIVSNNINTPATVDNFAAVLRSIDGIESVTVNTGSVDNLTVVFNPDYGNATISILTGTGYSTLTGGNTVSAFSYGTTVFYNFITPPDIISPWTPSLLNNNPSFFDTGSYNINNSKLNNTYISITAGSDKSKVQDFTYTRGVGDPPTLENSASIHVIGSTEVAGFQASGINFNTSDFNFGTDNFQDNVTLAIRANGWVNGPWIRTGDPSINPIQYRNVQLEFVARSTQANLGVDDDPYDVANGATIINHTAYGIRNGTRVINALIFFDLMRANGTDLFNTFEDALSFTPRRFFIHDIDPITGTAGHLPDRNTPIVWFGDRSTILHSSGFSGAITAVIPGDTVTPPQGFNGQISVIITEQDLLPGGADARQPLIPFDAEARDFLLNTYNPPAIVVRGSLSSLDLYEPVSISFTIDSVNIDITQEISLYGITLLANTFTSIPTQEEFTNAWIAEFGSEAKIFEDSTGSFSAIIPPTDVNRALITTVVNNGVRGERLLQTVQLGVHNIPSGQAPDSQEILLLEDFSQFGADFTIITVEDTTLYAQATSLNADYEFIFPRDVDGNELSNPEDKWRFSVVDGNNNDLGSFEMDYNEFATSEPGWSVETLNDGTPFNTLSRIRDRIPSVVTKVIQETYPRLRMETTPLVGSWTISLTQQLWNGVVVVNDPLVGINYRPISFGLPNPDGGQLIDTGGGVMGYSFAYNSNVGDSISCRIVNNLTNVLFTTVDNEIVRLSDTHVAVLETAVQERYPLPNLGSNERFIFVTNPFADDTAELNITNVNTPFELGATLQYGNIQLAPNTLNQLITDPGTPSDPTDDQSTGSWNTYLTDDFIRFAITNPGIVDAQFISGNQNSAVVRITFKPGPDYTISFRDNDPTLFDFDGDPNTIDIATIVPIGQPIEFPAFAGLALLDLIDNTNKASSVTNEPLKFDITLSPAQRDTLQSYASATPQEIRFVEGSDINYRRTRTNSDITVDETGTQVYPYRDGKNTFIKTIFNKDDTKGGLIDWYNINEGTNGNDNTGSEPYITTNIDDSDFS